MRKTLALAAMLAVPALSGCASWESMRLKSRHMNKPAADFELPTLDGGTVRLSSLKGKPVVLAFWAYG